MKSQDIFLMLKLRSLEQQQRGLSQYLSSQWQDWGDANEFAASPRRDTAQGFADNQPPAKTLEDQFNAQFTVRALGDSTGISKSEVSLALQRCYAAGLAKPDRLSNFPKVNESVLSLKYIALKIDVLPIFFSFLKPQLKGNHSNEV